MSSKRVAVIGAGPSGLTAIKCLKEEGIEPKCFEKTGHSGGLWRYHDDDVDGVASVMKTTIINSSKEMSTFSDFPPPDDTPCYMHNTEMFKFLLSYAEKFDLLKHICYNTEVIQVALAEDYQETGRLKVRTKNVKTGEVKEEVFDGVFVCIGHHVYPNIPTFPGQEKFKGKIIHTHSLKKVEEYEDQVVVIVGIGNSGVDAAVEISSVSKQVYLCARRGAWVISRLGPKGIPTDVALTTRFLNIFLHPWFLALSNSFMETYFSRRFDHSLYDLKPKHRFFSQHPTLSDALPIKLSSGVVKLRKNIKAFTEDGVIFEGEDVPTKVDSVILATGYQIKFPFLSDDLVTARDNKVHLYKYVYPPHLRHPTLAIIGLVQTIGALFPASEAQCRLAALAINGKVQLPDKKTMEEDIREHNEGNDRRYVGSKRHTIQVDFIDYLDEVYTMIGAKPNLLQLLFTDPELFLVVLFGPCLPYQYRLEGPHSWPGAREALLTYRKRIVKPLKSVANEKQLTEPSLKLKLFSKIMGLSLVLYALLEVIFFL